MIRQADKSLQDEFDRIQPDPDSQFRLLNCKCGSDRAVYVHYNGKGGAAWRCRCSDCGFTVDRGNKVRHDAQRNWNEAVRV